MTIKLGSTTINKVMVGATESKLIMLGGVIVHDKRAAPPAQSAWDVTGAAYASKSLYVGTQESAPAGLFIGDSGAKLYVSGGASGKVFQYTLGTAWDVSTGSYASKMFAQAIGRYATAIAFHASGTKMYTLDQKNGLVRQHSLSPAWDVSTAEDDEVTLDISTLAASASGMSFNANGTKLYVLGQSGRVVRQYTLSSGWNLATASYDSKFLGVAAYDNTPQGVFIGNSGDDLYVIGSASDRVHQFNLGTTDDIATASYHGYASVAAVDLVPTDVFFKSDGTAMYVVGINSDRVYQFSLA